MKLYLVQHGDALGKDIDPARPLSPTGEADVARMAAFLTQADVHVVRLLHSGKTRAQQTAEILAHSVLRGGTPEAASGLSPNDPQEPLLQDSARWNDDTMIVGHLPYMTKLVARLVAAQGTQPVVTFRPGTVACLERDENGAWAVAWMLPPGCLSDQFGEGLSGDGPA
ncbi:MAG: phosphohistidine phosphatase SixA [Pseudomonadota bacterium]|nr:MAG: phosphohistidine phosphatase SixA [Pseudomonadota bacterium]